MFKDYEKYVQIAGELFTGEDIPSQPSVITQIESELRREYADFAVVARLIGNDVSLSAATMLTVNSAFFGLKKKVGSIRHAVSILGIQNIVNLVKSIALRNAMRGNESPFFEEFWQTASETAMFAAFIARQLGRVSADDAYTVGLFHNVGLPIMFNKFENYDKKYYLGCRIKFKSVVEIENSNFRTNHCAVGTLLARSWKLPELFSGIILYHHHVELLLDNKDVEDEVKSMLCILKLAEHFCYINHQDYKYTNLNEWAIVGESVLKYLELDRDTMAELSEAIQQLLKESPPGSHR